MAVMLKKKKIIAIIPARGGSKGVKNKNLRLIAGKPLVAHSVEHALGCSRIDRVFVSTDDLKIGEIAQQYGAEFIKRPAAISDDTSSSESALQHALDHLSKTEAYEPDVVIFLQCTSPFRTSKDIELAIDKFFSEDADSLLSVYRTHSLLWKIENGKACSVNFDYRCRPRRQDMNPQFAENGSIYIFKPWVIKETGNRLGGKISLYVMREEAAWQIDSEHDFRIIEFLLLNTKHESRQ